METNDQNLAALETSVANLKPGRFLTVNLGDLCRTFGVETEEGAIEMAQALAKRHYRDFKPDREQGLGNFHHNG